MGRIGRFIDSCTPAMEDRLLTTAMVPWKSQGWNGPVPEGCLGGVAFGQIESLTRLTHSNTLVWFPEEYPLPMLHLVYNALCMRLGGFSGLEWRRQLEGIYPSDLCPSSIDTLTRGRNGAAKLAIMLRNRVLNNRAGRALAIAATPHGVAHV